MGDMAWTGLRALRCAWGVLGSQTALALGYAGSCPRSPLRGGENRSGHSSFGVSQSHGGIGITPFSHLPPPPPSRHGMCIVGAWGRGDILWMKRARSGNAEMKSCVARGLGVAEITILGEPTQCEGKKDEGEERPPSRLVAFPVVVETHGGVASGV